MAIRELSLFSGIGGGLLGSMLLGWEPVAFVENWRFAADLLRRRFPSVPIYGDVREFDASRFRGLVDIVTGGFPCQPFSNAGKKEGKYDERNMWPDTLRILVESGAPLGFFENVTGLMHRYRGMDAYFGEVLGSLAEAGFDAEWCVLGADDAGAPHHRKRVWILAYAMRGGKDVLARAVREAEENLRRSAKSDISVGRCSLWGQWHSDPAELYRAACCVLGDANRQRLEEQRLTWTEEETRACLECAGGWGVEPRVGRVADGIPKRVDRLRGLGNAQVPQSMALAFVVMARDAVMG